MNKFVDVAQRDNSNVIIKPEVPNIDCKRSIEWFEELRRAKFILRDIAPGRIP